MTSHRYWFAAQHDWGSQRGFYLNLENETPEPVCKLDTLRIALGIADGTNWRFIVGSPRWDWNATYTLRARITATGATLQLNETTIGESAGGFAPHDGTLEIGSVPSWASGQTEYRLTSHRVTIRSGSAKPLQVPLDISSDVPEPVRMFNPELIWGEGKRQVSFTPQLPLIMEVTFRFAPMPDWRKYQPYIDRFGQCRYVVIPNKVQDDADLRRDLERERRTLAQWGIPRDIDRYGGYRQAGWRETATGFYRVVRKQGYWWLITPEGYPCFYTGVCSVPALTWEMTPVSDRERVFEWLPPRTGEYASLWRQDVWGERAGTQYVCLHAVNLMRRFARDWRQQSIELAKLRLRTWGFCGAGKWDRLDNVTCAPVLGRWEVPNLVRHPDIFDPEVQKQFREHLRRQIEPHRNSPWVLGWSLGNEYDEIITRDEVEQMLQLPGAPPAKRALMNHALENIYAHDLSRLTQAWRVEARTREALYNTHPTPPQNDTETLRRFFADRYYGWIYRTIKEIDPNHLYFGFWIVPGWWQNEEDWVLSARHCDVLGYDRYAPAFTDSFMNRLIARIDKPILCGEFSFPAWHGGARAFGRYPLAWAKDEVETATLYAKWLQDAARHPSCVGVMWFQYRDQPLTGRGPGRGDTLVIGEHYAFGLVDLTDRPKWELLSRMRQANLRAPLTRLSAMK